MISSLLILLQIQAVAPLKIALIYPDALRNMNAQSAEMKCISEAVIRDFQQSGLKIEFQTYDNNREPAKTMEVSKKIAADGYDLVLGTTGSAEAMVAADILNAKEIPFISPNASLSTIVDERPYAFLFTANDTWQSGQLARYIHRSIKPKKVLILQNLSAPYSMFHTQEMQKNLSRLSPPPSVAVESFVDGEFQPQEFIGKVDAFQPDLIFTPISGPLLAGFYGALKSSKLNKKVHVLGSDHIGGRPQFIQALGGIDSRFPLRYVSMWDGKLNSKAKKDFERLHKKNCADQPITMPMVSAYDSTRMVLQKIKKTPGLRGAALAQKLRNQVYTGVMGKVVYRSENSPERHYQLFEIVGQTKQWVKALE